MEKLDGVGGFRFDEEFARVIIISLRKLNVS